MAEAVRKEARRMTVAEFLQWEDGTDTRFELVDGMPLAMAPSLQSHGELVTSVGAEIRARLRAPCRVASESGIRLPGRDDTFYTADLAVSCSPRVRGARDANEPVILIEVLSASTAAHDRGTKAADYRSIPSVKEIVLLTTTAVQAEVWRRTDSGWLIEDVIGQDAVLHLRSVDIEVPLRSIYADIALDVPSARAASA
jgi:Uma2 family endonuclease